MRMRVWIAIGLVMMILLGAGVFLWSYRKESEATETAKELVEIFLAKIKIDEYGNWRLKEPLQEQEIETHNFGYSGWPFSTRNGWKYYFDRYTSDYEPDYLTLGSITGSKDALRKTFEEMKGRLSIILKDPIVMTRTEHRDVFPSSDPPYSYSRDAVEWRDGVLLELYVTDCPTADVFWCVDTLTLGYSED